MGSSAISKELPQEMGGSMTKTQAVTNLVALEERCGPLCHFDKPVKIDEGEFMGHVTAKVVFLSLLDQKFFSHFMTRSFSLTSWPEVFLSLLDQNMHPRWIAPRCSLWKMSLLPQVRNCAKSQLWKLCNRHNCENMKNCENLNLKEEIRLPWTSFLIQWFLSSATRTRWEKV